MGIWRNDIVMAVFYACCAVNFLVITPSFALFAILAIARIVHYHRNKQ